MSISEIPKNDERFSANKNIRIAIAGLAICDLANTASKIRFLRHVPKHKLKMKIIKKKALDFSFVDSFEVEIGGTLKNIKITGGTSPSVPTFEHIPTSYQEYKLSKLLNFTLLHGHRLELRSILPFQLGSTTKVIESPTVLEIDYCMFYTAKLTEHKYNFKKKNQTTEIRFDDFLGEVLGGYMTVANELLIDIPGAIQPKIKLPVIENGVEYVYEIQFNNSCFEEDGTVCKETRTDRTDFLEFYQVLEDRILPIEEFDLKALDSVAKAATGTGACLPGCRTC
jgi:hypothetical protein